MEKIWSCHVGYLLLLLEKNLIWGGLYKNFIVTVVLLWLGVVLEFAA